MLKYFVICLLAIACKGASLQNDQPDDHEDDAYAQAFINLYNLQNDMLPAELCQLENLQVKFKLYTRENPNGDEIDIKNNQTLKDSSFNVQRATKILIHEWLQNETHSYAKDFVSAFLRYRDEAEYVNVITVDYGSISLCDFKTVRSMQPVIGQEIGNLLKTLIKYGAVPPDFHLIGLGMGSQIAGIAARQIHPKKVGRLTALDPTLIGYLNNKPQLVSNDSDFMDVIHTAQRKIDLVRHLGHARFYPNDGTRQPIAAGQRALDASAISHAAAALYYLETIVDVTYFEATRCQDYVKFVQKKCWKPNVYNYMGDKVNTSLRGNFYLSAPSAVPPFGERDLLVVEVNGSFEFLVKVRDVVIIDAEVVYSVKLEYERKRNSQKKYTEEEIKNSIAKHLPQSSRGAIF